MKFKQIQQKEVGDTPDFRETRSDEVGVEVPLPEVVETGDEAVRDEEHQPEDEAVEAAAAAPEGFVLVVRENHRQGHDKDQRDEADVRLRKFRLDDAPLQIFFQLRDEGSAITAFIRNQIAETQYEEDDAVDEGRDPVELKAKFQDIEVLVVGCEREDAEVEKHVNRHQCAGDAAEALINADAFVACLRILCCVSGFLLLTHREAPLSN